MAGTAVIIPAKNEAACIVPVIEGIRAQLPDCLIVIVDDHSDDGTGDLAWSCPGTAVLRSPVSIGIGGAVQLGIRFALSRGCDTFFRMDADGQHPPEHLPALLARLIPGALVQGSRDPIRFTASSNLIRACGSAWFRSLFKLFTGRPVDDPTSGYMCFGRDLAEKFSRFYPMDFPEIESLVLLARAGHGIVPVTVTMKPRAAGESSIGLLRGAVYMFSVSLAFFASFIRHNPYEAAHAA